MESEADLSSRILRILRFQPKGMSITDLSRKTGASRNRISHHMDLLQVSGKVDLRTIGNTKVYYPAQRVPLSAFLCFTRNFIIVLDHTQKIIQVNDQCLRFLGKTKEDLAGTRLSEAGLPVVSTPEAIAVIDHLEKEQIVTDLTYRSDGRDLFFQMQVIPTTFEDGSKGCTLVLEDITEQKRYLRNMEFLARTSMELVNLPHESDIFRYIGMRVAELVPVARIFVNYFDEVRRQYVMRAILDQEFRDGLMQILGRDAVGLTFPYDNLFGDQLRETLDSVFSIREHVFRPASERGEYSFYDICFRQIPEELCEAILDRFTIGKFYHVALMWQDRLFGMVGIFLSPGEKLEEKHAVESFIRQASIAIARRQTEDHLRQSEKRFREVINLSPVPAGIIDPEGNYTFVNQAFTNLFGYKLADIPNGREWFEKAFPDPGYRGEALAAWKSDLANTAPGKVRPRTFRVRCSNDEVKDTRFLPATLSDGNQYIVYEEVSGQSG
jgi:PAS domain S-box-containing protein